MMALTATATKTLLFSVCKTLGLRNPFTIALSPCKRNLKYIISKFDNVETTFNDLVTSLRSKRTNTPRTIIYCRTFDECHDIYVLFKEALNTSFTHPEHAPDITRYRLIEMFTSVTDEPIKEESLPQSLNYELL